MILLTILGGTPVLGPGLVHIILCYVGNAVQWILGCLLFCAFGAVMRAAGKKAALEWVLLAVWSVSCILPILSALMGVNDVTAQQAAQAHYNPVSAGLHCAAAGCIPRAKGIYPFGRR